MPEGVGTAGDVCLLSSGIVEHNLVFVLSLKAYVSMSSVKSVRIKSAGSLGGGGAVAAAGAAGAAGTAAAAAAGTSASLISKSIKLEEAAAPAVALAVAVAIMLRDKKRGGVHWSTEER